MRVDYDTERIGKEKGWEYIQTLENFGDLC